VNLGYYILNTYQPERDGDAASLYGRYLEQVEAAEALGFRTVWATEHHFHHFGGMTPSPQLLLTAIAQRCPRLRLGTSVSILPLRNPIQVAEDFAMLDVLSGGRLEFGAGRGMALSGYVELGIDYASGQDRFKEALTLIDRAWTEPTVAFEGQYYRCPALTVLPRPLQQPRPPIWVTASADPASFRWIGERGYDLMILPWLFPIAEQRVPLYREARAAAGHAGPGRVLAMYPTHIADDPAAARARAEPCWAYWRSLLAPEMAPTAANRAGMAEQVQMLDYDRVVAERHVPFGGVETALALVRWLESFGVTHLGLTFHFGGIDHAAALRAIELWAREVVPDLSSPALLPGAGRGESSSKNADALG
jgi:alkanesulfonate monooxygenase SsuD/methylene tetrahydromethanopterin reductase-like flavin-dependent oxidoreductase (luciferase family)